MRTEKTEVVIVGIGRTGAIIAAELAKAGMKVVGLERGPRHVTADFAGQEECYTSSVRNSARTPSANPSRGVQIKTRVPYHWHH